MRPLGSDERGATLVEFVIVLPLLFMLIFGIIDLARLVAAHSTANTASREAARYGSSTGLSPNGIPRYTDCDEILDATLRVNLLTFLEAGNVSIAYDDGPSTAVFAACPQGGPVPSPALFTDGDRVIVTVSRPFEFLTPFIDSFFDPIVVTSVDRRSLELG